MSASILSRDDCRRLLDRHVENLFRRLAVESPRDEKALASDAKSIVKSLQRSQKYRAARRRIAALSNGFIVIELVHDHLPSVVARELAAREYEGFVGECRARLRLHGPFARSINCRAQRLAAELIASGSDPREFAKYAANKLIQLALFFELVRESVKQPQRGAPRKRPWYSDLVAATALLWRFVHGFERAWKYEPIAAILEIPELRLKMTPEKVRKTTDEIVRRLDEEKWARLYTVTKFVHDLVGHQSRALDRRQRWALKIVRKVPGIPQRKFWKVVALTARLESGPPL